MHNGFYHQLSLPSKSASQGACPGLVAGPPTPRRRLPAVPYRGIGRNDLWWSLRVAAVNLRRLLALGLTRQDQTWALA